MTQFTVLSHDNFPADWPNSHQRIETWIEGELADAVRAYYVMDGEVTYKQFGVEDGYSEWTVEWSWDTILCIDDVPVWSSDGKLSEHVDVRPGWGPNDLGTHLYEISQEYKGE